jgi:DNA-binding MarR family transcriptional regulator
VSIRINSEVLSLKNELKQISPDWLLDTYRSIIYAALAMESYTDKNLLKYSVKQPGLAILRWLVESNGMSSQERLVKRSHRTKQASSFVLRNLEKRKLIVRTKVENGDRRKRMVEITEEGLDLIKAWIPIEIKFWRILTSSISQDEGKQLSKIMKRTTKIILKEMKKSSYAKETS